ncbi:hypothetical protein C8Q79DRAFT_1005856 [Trametes meyenii]|nr:hypothetical protein C8Q79DRAFT_1005856 [Trametes meyenii]
MDDNAASEVHQQSQDRRREDGPAVTTPHEGRSTQDRYSNTEEEPPQDPMALELSSVLHELLIGRRIPQALIDGPEVVLTNEDAFALRRPVPAGTVRFTLDGGEAWAQVFTPGDVTGLDLVIRGTTLGGEELLRRYPLPRTCTEATSESSNTWLRLFVDATITFYEVLTQNQLEGIASTAYIFHWFTQAAADGSTQQLWEGLAEDLGHAAFLSWISNGSDDGESMLLYLARWGHYNIPEAFPEDRAALGWWPFDLEAVEEELRAAAVDTESEE